MTHLLLVFCSVFLPYSPVAVEDHAIYLSTIAMHVQEDDVSVQLKVFEDDLRDAVRSHSGVITDHSDDRFESLVESYFVEHFIVSTNSSDQIEMSVTEIEKVGDSYVIQGALSVPSDNQIISITGDYFMELFPTQQNILIIHDLHGDKKYYTFKKGKESIQP